MALPASRRVLFRDMRPDDAPQLRTMFADDYARRIYPAMQDETAIARWIAWNQENYRNHGFGLWTIETHEGDFIGDCGLSWQNADGQPVLEIGYHVTLRQRGQGYALEAARAVLDFGFSHIEADEITSIVSPDNPASIAVASKLHREKREYTKPDGARRLLFFTRSDTASGPR